MDRKEKESLISKQERAARQQELLEKKRRAKAEYNISSSKPVRKSIEKKPIRPKRPKKEVTPPNFTQRRKAAPEKKVVPENMERYASVSQWFLSICWLKIPVIGFIYALFMAFSRKTPYEKRNFARGYILYRILVLLLSMTVLYVIYRIGLDFIDQLLSYVK